MTIHQYPSHIVLECNLHLHFSCSGQDHRLIFNIILSLQQLRPWDVCIWTHCAYSLHLSLPTYLTKFVHHLLKDRSSLLLGFLVLRVLLYSFGLQVSSCWVWMHWVRQQGESHVSIFSILPNGLYVIPASPGFLSWEFYHTLPLLLIYVGKHILGHISFKGKE